MALAMVGCGGGGDGGGGGGTTVPAVGPYQTCDPSVDYCSHGLGCLGTTLPASAGYTGYLCTSTCGSDGDCGQLIDNYAAICVNGQCYTQCPDGGGSCPYGTACLAFSDDTGGEVDLCSP